MNRNFLALRQLWAMISLLTCFFTLPVGADTGTLTTIYSFNVGGGISGPDAANPIGIILGTDGNFYGTSLYGGTGGGAVFKLTPGGTETVLLSFDGTNGSLPTELVQGSDGDLYGTTNEGGANGFGTVYKIATSGVQTVLYNFTNDGGAGTRPSAGMIEGPDGNFYGTNGLGGSGSAGTIFRITPSGQLTVLHSFDGTDGSQPRKMTLGKDGNLYGLTLYGGSAGAGTVFRMALDGTFTTLYTFAGSPDAAQPDGPLIQASDGNFYGITSGGGSGPCTPYFTTNCGTVFKVTPAGQETVLHSFAGTPDDGNANCFLCGWNYEQLVEGSDGNLYGMTLGGGSYTSPPCGGGRLWHLVYDNSRRSGDGTAIADRT